MSVEQLTEHVAQANEHVDAAIAVAAEIKTLKAACDTAGPSPVTQQQAERALELARLVEDIDHLLRDAVALGIEATFGITYDDAQRVLESVDAWDTSIRQRHDRYDELSMPQGMVKDHLARQKELVAALLVKSRLDAQEALKCASGSSSQVSPPRPLLTASL